MKFLKATVLAAWAVTGAVARPQGAPADDVEVALAEQDLDATTISQLTGPNTGCEEACDILLEGYGPKKVFTRDTSAYHDVTKSYWAAQQAEVSPMCIFVPSTDAEVSFFVLASRAMDCPFAARSGGHAAFAGASSSQGGMTVLFRDLNEITLSDDKSVVSIGPGNTWGQVYRALEPHGLAVVGGRMSDIGVGGLLTGGGISYYSNQYGWALDNVESFEVVNAKPATEHILKASETENPDLYWALRGGGNNLGLVTKFNLYTIPSTLLQGTTRVYTENQSSEVLDAFFHVASNAKVDGHAQQYVIFGHMGGSNMISAELTYTKNVSDPAIFQKYRSIPAISDTTSTKTLLEYCDDISAGDQKGLREMFWNRSFRMNEEFANWVVKHFYSVVPSIDNLPGAVSGLVFQVITEPILEKMARAGGNALGLDISNGPILLIHMLSMWNSTSHDDAMYRFANDFFADVAAEAESQALGNEFIYMNYASQFQDVISSYGSANKARLREIAAKYDPFAVYQTLQPGHFKLTHAPVSNPY
ncbi:hypothetical protein BJX61DRAFT_540941 [Aspergillus egyptiacus]|nr:hypothetical protein BJX61DRAFT_540941 [Aspergillus egyptiacus]